ncbi:hypothetical protein PPYR_12245 [Photinus pyralis]|uniref:Uncharacterized protein n=1 Tax=Photinus pyralis TaxID=7054 RepID=A0A5N4ADL2_PHOPY|nr:uncharacterized protein LOC116175388 isoform X2 [Photinus pyralis]KAB0795406.1 hypothetical protein PPYR_12245 [Photinus pyralis]
MEVVAATPNGTGVPPFHNHDVHEWSRIDSLTGVLERARLETDHWTARTSHSSHNYGKVVDTRARSNADGAIQQARRQLEVFQSSVPGGRLQVIKSHTVSSSRWTSKSEHKDVAPHFTDLELPLNPLDLTSQKSRATVGRSVGRRPPSRPRGRDEPRQILPESHSTVPANLHRISRLCNQVHENAVKQTFGKYHKPPIHERESGDGVEIIEIERPVNEHTNLSRTKSTSSEDIHLTPEKEKQNKSVEDLEDLEQLQNWRRTSKIRRSLQFPTQNKTSTTKPLDVPISTGSVRKIREDLETGRRLNTALRGNNVDLEALDHILQLITSPSDVHSGGKFEEPEKDEQNITKQPKRHSFVTVESLQEVRGRLRRTSSPVDTIVKSKKDEEPDDGIVTEDPLNKQLEDMPALDSASPQSRVRSYVYGMEVLMNKKPIVGTGSLESRTSRQLNGSINRNEDWYNRRKSYGFEQVHNQEPTNTISKNNASMDSSTDSGICRSSEIMLVPTTNKSSVQLNKSSDLNDSQKDEIYNRINKYNTPNESAVPNIGNVKRYASIFEQKRDSSRIRDYEGTKITIPIVPEGYHDRELDCSPFSYNRNIHNGEIKRHSIAVDESRYVTQAPANHYRRTSLAINDKTADEALDDDFSQGKRHKKVEFCKTEVHFAVDSGRVNIVATDEKPPPTNNFRRRRRNSATLYNNLLTEANKNGLPVLHFGDSSYEKNMFNFTNQEDELNFDALQIADAGSKPNDQFCNGTVTVSTNQTRPSYGDDVDEEEKESAECETPKGILKNKPIKPKPYLLGDDPYCIDKPVNDEKQIWGVKLKPVHSDLEPQMWKSTVTLKNTLYDKNCNLRRVEQDEPVNETRSELDQFDNIRIVSSQLNGLRPVEDLRRPEIKGYSTKVNIGSGEAVVIEDVKRQILNKGLVVRIGHGTENAHTICSKTTSNDSTNTTTTTKITIDLAPSPIERSVTLEPTVRLPRASISNFKSTSLVLNTFKNEIQEANIKAKGKSNIPQQLEALRKLYEDWPSDSEADKEVQQLMNASESVPVKELDDATSSVVSGSWSKMRAFRNMQQQRAKIISDASEVKFNSNARLEKGSLNVNQTITDVRKEPFTRTPTMGSSPSSDRRKIKIISKTPNSPVVLRRVACDPKRQELRASDKLSSPSLVGQNLTKTEPTAKLGGIKKESTPESVTMAKLWGKRSPTPKIHIYNTLHSPVVQRKGHTPSPTTENHYSTIKDKDSDVDSERSPNRSVLRNPRRSEMAYFGVKVAPSPKPYKKGNVDCTTKSPVKPESRTYYKPRAKSPIYENVEEIKKTRHKTTVKEFDSSILDELTKAADQILQAVNGYAEEAEKQSLEEKQRNYKKEKLDTISETKSWKQRSVTKHNCTEKTDLSKPKLKHTSSTSSVESITEARKATTVGTNRRSVVDTDKHRKKSGSDSSSSRAATKARRLQRASSREALLQSHGSSSEDLPISIDVPVRKSRVARKGKTVQVGDSHSVESKSRRQEEKGKSEERVPVGALPTIRHKTAVSTIRSTAEKAQSRERSHRTKNEDIRKKGTLKKETIRTTPSRSDRNANTTSREAITHRISTANIKKCTNLKS